MPMMCQSNPLGLPQLKLSFVVFQKVIPECGGRLILRFVKNWLISLSIFFSISQSLVPFYCCPYILSGLFGQPSLIILGVLSYICQQTFPLLVVSIVFSCVGGFISNFGNIEGFCVTVSCICGLVVFVSSIDGATVIVSSIDGATVIVSCISMNVG